MTNNREREPEVDMVHLFIALRRKKENDGMELCFRQVIKHEDGDLASLKAKIATIPGIWRIYRTVNARKVEPARRLLMKKLIDYPNEFQYRIDSLWKNCLLQKECKGERNFMIDVDTKEIIPELQSMIHDDTIKVDETIKTPNGYHLICPKLDTRLLQGISDVEVKRDDIKFVELIKNE